MPLRWRQLPQSGQVPPERSSHTLTLVGDKLYLFGGEHCPRVPVGSELYEYDLATGVWSVAEVKGGTPPSPRLAHTAAAVGPLLYVFGGRSGLEMGEGAMNDLHAYDTRSRTWSEVAAGAGTAPPARSYHASATIGSKIYVFGGCGQEGRLNDLHVFDTGAGAWEALPTPNSDAVPGRGGSCLVASASGGSLYVLAGFCGRELADVHEYKVDERVWCGATCPSCTSNSSETDDKAKAQVPLPRSVFGAALHACGPPPASSCGHGGHVLAFGGEVDPSDKGHDGAGDFTDSLVCFDPAAGGWHQLQLQAGASAEKPLGDEDGGSGGDKPCARGWFAVAAAPGGSGGMFVSGGLDTSNERLGDLYVLEEVGGGDAAAGGHAGHGQHHDCAAH